MGIFYCRTEVEICRTHKKSTKEGIFGDSLQEVCVSYFTGEILVDFYLNLNRTHIRYAKLISLKTIQVTDEQCAQLLVLVSI